MNKGFATLVLTLSLAAPTAFANNPIESHDNQPWQFENDIDVLSTKDKLNRNLESGEYLFANLHETKNPNKGTSFFDEWSFTLANTSNVTVNLFDVELPLGNIGKLFSDDAKYGKKSNAIGSLLDNKFLTVSLFDEEGTLLGTAGEDGTLSALGLTAGNWYTLAVSGKAAGLFGGLYHGSVAVAHAPIGDTLPLFASALVVAAWRLRKNKTLPA